MTHPSDARAKPETVREEVQMHRDFSEGMRANGDHANAEWHADRATILQSDGRGQAASGLRVYRMADLEALPAVEWLIDGWLQPDALHVTYGASGVGKSLLALDWGACVASGRPWQGLETRKVPVLLIIQEGLSGLRVRNTAWLEANKATHPEDLLFVTEPINMLDPADVQSVCDLVTKNGVGLVQIDTLSRVIPGGDENSGSDMGAFIANCSRIQACGAAVNVIHHSGHAETKRERGWSGLPAAADVRIRVTMSGSNVVRVESVKLKDGTPPPTLNLQITPGSGSVVLEPAKPTAMMKEIVQYIAAYPGATVNDIKKNTKGNATSISEAIGQLIADGRVYIEPGLRNANLHYVTEQ
jgi:hypothetical protein